ncbi:hypothetical protein MtrunA17_Chr7g0237551 [Medicago truncatula]|uniref:Transmembrane protein n=1 Tax=Medicago truncatula TaxID=3880 RepID=A0A396H4F9_MEDTR|nr:hypothetical protein MtrunA17_Chr7g0237551 [Medicago truncatula]
MFYPEFGNSLRSQYLIPLCCFLFSGISYFEVNRLHITMSRA